ncbi:MAG TPA: PA14 domain-containing protein [Planctomycetota bacterium]
MRLKFLGDWNPWLGAAVALALGFLAWRIYRRESRSRASKLAWILPALRCAAIALAVLILTGPVLHRRHVVGERGRVLVFVDASASMGLSDEALETPRKLLALHRLGWLPSGALDPELAEAADALGRARIAAGGDAVDPAAWKDAARACAKEVQAAAERLGKVKPETGGIALERRGVALREVWTGVQGRSIEDLKRHPAFPGKPDQTSTPESLEAPSNWADNYGERIRAYVTAPAAGNYVFWVAGDDLCELWLSPDTDPGKKKLIARVPSHSELRGWDGVPDQKSAPYKLAAGQKVYLEILHKESTANDGVAVGWQLPDGKMERPIPSNRLSAPARDVESPAQAGEGMLVRFKEEVLAPAQRLAEGRDETAKAVAAFAPLLASISRWEKELRDAFGNYAGRVAASPSKAVLESIQKFDALPRWKRAEAALLGGPKSLVERLAEKHHVEILALDGPQARVIWSTGRDTDEPLRGLPRAFPGEPAGRVTDLSGGVRARTAEKSEERLAAILLTDGRHNDGTSPIQAARMLGNREIRVHPVGFGATGAPEDLALLDVRAPSSVFFKDRVRGEAVLKDDMPANRPFTVKIESDGQVLWEKTLATERSGTRRIPFDVPIQALVEKKAGGAGKGVEVLNLPLDFQVTVTAADGDREKRNNAGAFSLHAVTHKRKALVLDGRPRWETRYLRNLLERDEQWEVNALVADRGNAADAWARGKDFGKFPNDKETLFGYDLVVFGEVPRQFLKMEELEWLREFVDKRGGGLLVIDGRRGHVASFADTPLAALFPVDWKAEPMKPKSLRPSEQGAKLALLALAAEPEKNLETWASLPAPHWTAGARSLPGSETLLEAVEGERRVPALVFRRFGAGKVLYSGFDESWRWRQDVADLHHQKFWNQVVRHVMEPPFTVRDAKASLGVGKLVYAAGEAVEVRARVRDADGRPLMKGDVEALLFAGDKAVGTVKLAPDENAGGLFHGQAGQLAPGRYEARLKAPGLGDDSRIRAEFVVRAPEAGELASLTCNEDLLRQIAAQSGGTYYREEELAALEAKLDPLSRERVFESDTALWQSWGWFLPIIALLTAEWILRKWAGLL